MGTSLKGGGIRQGGPFSIMSHLFDSVLWNCKICILKSEFKRIKMSLHETKIKPLLQAGFYFKSCFIYGLDQSQTWGRAELDLL